MKIFKELNKLGYIHYSATTIKELDDLPLNSAERISEQSLVFRWFRENKLADGSVCRHGKADGSYSYRWDIVYEYGVYEERHFKQDYKTYEEA